MSDATQTETTQQPQQPQAPAPEPTLDDVYREAGSPPLEGQAPVQPAAQPQSQQPAPQPAAPTIPQPPDPFDTEAHKAYIARLAAVGAQTQQGLTEVARFLSQQQAREQKAALEADIAKAVTTVNDIVKHPKPKVLEAMLDAKARENPQFKALWENRSRNPVAWGNALKVVAKEFATELEVKVDPKLVESQRALKIAQKAMATTDREEQTSPVEEQLAKAEGPEFDSLWDRIREG